MSPRGACGELKGGRPLRAEAASADGRGGIALDLDDLVVLDVDLLATADRAVRTDGGNHPFGGAGARPELLRVCGSGRPATRQRVGSGQLSVDGPVADPGAHTHYVSSRAAGLLYAVAGVPPSVTCRGFLGARSVRRTVRRARHALDDCRSAGPPPAGADLVRIRNLRVGLLIGSGVNRGAWDVPGVLIRSDLLIGRVSRYRLRCRPPAVPRGFRAVLAHGVLASSHGGRRVTRVPRRTTSMPSIGAPPRGWSAAQHVEEFPLGRAQQPSICPAPHDMESPADLLPAVPPRARSSGPRPGILSLGDASWA